MKIADFFQELWPPSFGIPAESLRDSLTSSPYEDSKEITEYLLAGHNIYSVMGSSEDVLSSGRAILGGDSIYTDGEWLWRGDLWFYVRAHHVKLPEEFLAQIRESNYAVPAENEPQLIEIAKYVQKNL